MPTLSKNIVISAVLAVAAVISEAGDQVMHEATCPVLRLTANARLP